MPKRIRKKHRKKTSQNRFGPPFWPPKTFPTSTQHRKKTHLNANFLDFFRCWVDFGRVLEAKMEAKIIFFWFFFRCFFRMRFGIDFEWILGASDLEKSIKTIGFSMVFVDFHKIDVFEKSAKKPRFWSRFRKPKP